MKSANDGITGQARVYCWWRPPVRFVQWDDIMTQTTPSPPDSRLALKYWAEYQRLHDVSERKGQAVGIDPVSEKIWFGESSLDITLQQDAAGDSAPLYYLRVGQDYYGRKGGLR